MQVEEKKNYIFYVLDVLKKYSDENHLLTYQEIIDKLVSDHNLKPNTKTVGRLVDSLIAYGFDIIKRGKLGCALVSRLMDNSELLFLIDAIFSSKAISSKHAKGIIDVLMKESSIYERKKYEYIYKVDDIARTKNNQTFYNIDVISRAIENNNQISFNYNEYSANKKCSTRNNGKIFTINPYYLINNNGKYYLVCNYDKYDNLANYRVDSISNIKTLATPIKNFQDLEDVSDFSIDKYVNEHIYMFSGKSIEPIIKLNNPKVITDIIDWFGENVDIKESKDEILVKLKVNEQAFLYWALQYGMSIEIIKPISTREKYKKMLNEIIMKYEGNN